MYCITFKCTNSHCITTKNLHKSYDNIDQAQQHLKPYFFFIPGRRCGMGKSKKGELVPGDIGKKLDIPCSPPHTSWEFSLQLEIAPCSFFLNILTVLTF